MFAAIVADDCAGNERTKKPDDEVRPRQVDRHRGADHS
jgi:hypothetical protein